MRKFTTAATSRRRYLEFVGFWISRAMRRSADKFLTEAAHFEAVSERSLQRILSLNRRTEFARRCGLDSRARRQVFESLPPTEYVDYAPYIQRLAAGERHLMSGEPLVYFSNTSGTTGPPKMIPVTRGQNRTSMMAGFTAMGLALRAGMLKPMRGRFMTIMIDHQQPPTPGGVQTGSATTNAFRQLAPIQELIITSPVDVQRISELVVARYLHLLFGLAEQRLWTITSFFPAMVLFAMRDLQARAEELLRDLADGTINRELALAPEVRRRLERRLRPAPERARKLSALLERGEFTVGGIWPDIGSIMTATGGAFRFYADQLRPYLGGVPIFSPLYSASEGMLGFGFSADHPHYLLPPRPTYIELLPVADANDPSARPVAASRATPGECYEVVVTTLSGFVRYRMHDIVKVLDFCGQGPIIEFVEREGQVINVSSEKTAEHHIVEAIDIASHLVDEPLVDYFVLPDLDPTPGVYILAIEEWGSGCDHRKVLAFLRAVDTALCKVAPFYEEERQLGTIGPMQALLLKPGAFARYRERLTAAGAPPSQVKTPHAIPDPGFVRQHFADEVLARVAVEGEEVPAH
jgi:hypothetical protein